jgi:hypothetical protein
MPEKKARKQTFDKKVKKIVIQELKNELEEKNAITDYVVDLKSLIPAVAVTNGAGNFFKILPDIFQSTVGS